MLVEVRACSICATDVKMARAGQRDLRYPRILGHEVAGVVVECGTDDFNPGDRVQIAPGIACGRCPACRRGADNRCEQIGILGFTHDGGMARFMAVPAEVLRLDGISRLPGNLSFEEASLAEPLACCINAQARTRVSVGDSVLIWGAGPVGCLHAMLARSKGASHVLLVEQSPTRMALAERAGADAVIEADMGDVRSAVSDMTAGRGVDVVIFACRERVEPWLELLASGGRICMFSGLPADETTFSLDANLVHYRELELVGAYGCTSAQNRESIEFMAGGAIDVSWLITKRVSLDDLEAGLQHAERQEGMKAVVTEF